MKEKDNNLFIGILVIVGIILFLGILSIGFGGFGGYGMMSGYGMMGGYGSGMMFFGWLSWILIIALIIAGIYWLIKTANRR